MKLSCNQDLHFKFNKQLSFISFFNIPLAMTVVDTNIKKEESTPIINDDKKLRFSIIIVLLLTAIIIGFPSWYLTTSVERASLPIDEMNLLNEKCLNGINYKIPVQISGYDIDINELQIKLDEKLLNSNAKISIINEINNNDTNTYQLKIIPNDIENKLIVSPNSDKLIELYVTNDNIMINDLISRVLIDSIFNLELNYHQIDNISKLIKLPFNKNYKISINFLHENNKIFPNKEILQKSINNFQNFINSLNTIANFTIEFQELWHEKRIITENEYINENNFTVIKDINRFVDYSNWGLDQDFDINPIINLNLYLPDGENLLIENSQKNSFIISKWGSVIILNDDEVNSIDYNKMNEIFDIFAFQLLKLIGINSETDNFNNDGKSLFFKIDEFIRIQTIKNINESLINFQNLNKLINQLKTIPIPLKSVEEINQSIIEIENTLNYLNNSQWYLAYKTSINAVELSNNAFFHKDMVQQAYFPEEHKMAVYSPLLGPFATIMIMAIVRGIKELKAK